MYSIEYYKKKRKEPEWFHEEIRMENFETEHDYLEHVNLVKKYIACWNIKSLTIDVEDLRLLHDTLPPYFDCYCEYSCDSSDLYDICSCAEKLLKAEIITIPNNDIMMNVELIYHIINTKWLINKDNYEYSCKYSKDDAIKEIISEMHSVLTKIDASKNESPTKWDCVLSDYLKQLRHYCYESEKINRGEIEEVQEKAKRLGPKQLNQFFDRYDY